MLSGRLDLLEFDEGGRILLSLPLYLLQQLFYDALRLTMHIAVVPICQQLVTVPVELRLVIDAYLTQPALVESVL